DAMLEVMVADFDSDGRADIVTGQGEAGSFQNRIYMNVSGPADTIPPDVQRTEQLDDTCDVAGPYPVRTAIFDGITSDRGFFDRGVVLNYAVDGGPVQQVPMKWVGNSIWRGEIPGQRAGSHVEYSVAARDYALNEGTGPTLDFTITTLDGDLNGDGQVGVDDQVQVILGWGPCPEPPADCLADLDGDGIVGVNDLLIVILGWGGCRQ
ncbi:MAG: hypothetical protein ACYTGC_19955, partial [Planctomycetota bacterium]